MKPGDFYSVNVASKIKRLLRSPKLIIGELAGLAAFGAVGACHESWHVFGGVWFAALTAVTTLSLAIVVLEQFRRLRTGWALNLTEANFNSAPLKMEFHRPATSTTPLQKIWSERRLGLAGSAVFHSGLLALILAGLCRALFATDAATDLLETETLAPQAAAWTSQFPGLAAAPFSLDRQITLRDVSATRYADGDLRSLSLRVGVDGAEKEIQVNQQVHVGNSRIFSAREFGPAAVVEWTQNGSSLRLAVLLSESGAGNYEGELAAAKNLRAYFRSHIDAAGNHAEATEVRVMNGNALLAAEILSPGATLALPDGGKITLRGLPFWARIHGSRDSALWLAYAGMILTMTGAAMMFCLIKLDFCVVITPLGELEKVFVALKPQRFAPLFQERFETLVREQREIGLRAPRQKILESETQGRASLVTALQNAAVCVLLLASLVFVSGCGRVSKTDAKKLVERYNQVVSEAYRRGDVRLIDPVVGPNEGKRLLGLIGVRSDLGITLDSELVSLEIVGIAQTKDFLEIRTKEHWHYRDLKIGSGEQVGQASEDFYEMTYHLTNANKVWLVDEIKFAAPPQVGRTNTPWIADRKDLHVVAMQEVAP
jgi:hypothetical protein